jgi:hypothetical protein
MIPNLVISSTATVAASVTTMQCIFLQSSMHGKLPYYYQATTDVWLSTKISIRYEPIITLESAICKHGRLCIWEFKWCSRYFDKSLTKYGNGMPVSCKVETRTELYYIWIGICQGNHLNSKRGAWYYRYGGQRE